MIANDRLGARLRIAVAATTAALTLVLASPTMAQDETLRQSALMAPMGLDLYVYFAEPVRPESVRSPTDREIKMTEEHLEYLELLAEQGRLIMAGPSLDPPYTTVVVFLASGPEQARRMMESDPAVVGGRFRARLSRFNVFLMPVVEPVAQR